jgi:hypothetical protein
MNAKERRRAYKERQDVKSSPFHDLSFMKVWIEADRKERIARQQNQPKPSAPQPPKNAYGQVDYNKYMVSEAWNAKKQKYWTSKVVKQCVSCGNADEHFDLHHLTYERLGYEDHNDLVFLCRGCHVKVHQLVDYGLATIRTAPCVLREMRGFVRKPNGTVERMPEKWFELQREWLLAPN